MGARRRVRIVLLVLFSLLFFFSGHYIEQIEGRQQKPVEELLYLPSGAYIKPFLLGYDQILADIVWVRTIQYFAVHFLTDQNFTWLKHLLDLVVTLDPKFRRAYEWGGRAFRYTGPPDGSPPTREMVEESIAFLERGMKEFPSYWRFPYMIGFLYFIELQDPATAAPFLEQAMRLPDAPAFWIGFATRARSKSGERELARQFLLEQYWSTKDKVIRERIRQHYLKLYLTEEEIQQYQQAVERFYRQYHQRFPYLPVFLAFLLSDRPGGAGGT